MAMTVTEFAKHVGVSPPAISKAVKRGRVLMGADGYIDETTQVQRWHEMRNVQFVRSHVPPGGAENPIDLNPPVPKPGPTGGKPPSKRVGRRPSVITHETTKRALNYDELKTKKLGVDLEIAQEELKKVKETTVSKDEVRRALTSFSRLIRDKWVNFPDRYGAEIAAACGCGPKLLMAELSKAVRLQLEEIANVKATLPE